MTFKFGSIGAVLAVVIAMFAAQLGVTSPAIADPVEDPCQLAVTFLCRFVPIAPQLEGDVDLSQQPSLAEPSAPSPDVPLPDSVQATTSPGGAAQDGVG